MNKCWQYWQHLTTVQWRGSCSLSPLLLCNFSVSWLLFNINSQIFGKYHFDVVKYSESSIFQVQKMSSNTFDFQFLDGLFSRLTLLSLNCNSNFFYFFVFLYSLIWQIALRATQRLQRGMVPLFSSEYLLHVTKGYVVIHIFDRFPDIWIIFCRFSKHKKVTCKLSECG